jgi:flavorubredoxin
MDSVRIVDGVHWIGALDPERTVFDVIMPIDRGTTYNAYVVRGADKVAVVEAGKDQPGICEQFLGRLRSVVDPARVDYVILNHLEPDHSGALAAFLEAAPNARVVVSKNGEHFVRHLLNRDVQPMKVGDGDSLELGGRTLRFITAPFLHWPDTMFTYLEEDRILFSGDFLGSHYSDERMFNDLTGDFHFYFKYYYDVIMRPFKEYVLKALDKIAPLPIDIVCPSHGPVLRQGLQAFLQDYRSWSQPPDAGRVKRAVVAYASAYGNTGSLARQVAEGLRESGVQVDLVNLGEGKPDDLVDRLEAADALALGSPTFVGDAIKPVWELLADLATIKLRGKAAAAFGSYGWSGEAVGALEERLKSLKFKLVTPGVRAILAPTEEDLEQARDLGRRVAAAIG